MNTISIFNKTYSIPSALPEVSRKTMFKILPHLVNFNADNEEDMLYRRAKVLHALLPIYNHQWNLLLYPNNVGVLHQLLGLTSFLFTDFGTTPLFTEFSHKGIVYLLPSARMANASLIEYAFADKAFLKLQALPNTPQGNKEKLELITRITAILCRPQRTDISLLSEEYEGDPRKKFSTPLVEARIEAFKNLPFSIKQAVFLYFVACRKWLHQNFKILFDDTKAKDDKKEGFAKTKLNAPDFGWMGIIFQLAESGTFGPFDEAKHFFLHTACYHLSQKAYQYYEANEN